MMTTLTEQNGKKTHYYIKLPNSEVFIGDEFALSLYRNCKDGDKVEVLGEVPSYGELSFIKNDLTAANGLLKHEKEKNDQLKKWCEEFNALDVAKENIKLKELLKECRDKWDCYKPYDKHQLLKRIDQVLANNQIQANTVACNKIQENE